MTEGANYHSRRRSGHLTCTCMTRELQHPCLVLTHLPRFDSLPHAMQCCSVILYLLQLFIGGYVDQDMPISAHTAKCAGGGRADRHGARHCCFNPP